MRHLTKKEIEALAENKEVRDRISRFLAMDGENFFQEVRSRLSPGELEEYLEENPDERVYMRGTQNQSRQES